MRASTGRQRMRALLATAGLVPPHPTMLSACPPTRRRVPPRGGPAPAGGGGLPAHAGGAGGAHPRLLARPRLGAQPCLGRGPAQGSTRGLPLSTHHLLAHAIASQPRAHATPAPRSLSAWRSTKRRWRCGRARVWTRPCARSASTPTCTPSSRWAGCSTPASLMLFNHHSAMQMLAGCQPTCVRPAGS